MKSMVHELGLFKVLLNHKYPRGVIVIAVGNLVITSGVQTPLLSKCSLNWTSNFEKTGTSYHALSK